MDSRGKEMGRLEAFEVLYVVKPFLVATRRTLTPPFFFFFFYSFDRN